MKPAIFLDRDGTIIKDKGCIGNTNQVEFYRYTFDCLKQLQRKYLLFIITNQPGIAQGVILLEQAEKVNLYIQNILKNKGIEIQAVYCCPHHKNDECKCRKPKTYFIEKASSTFSLDLKTSYVIGDHVSDMKLAINAKVKGIYLLTGHGKRHYKELSKNTKNGIMIKRNLLFATNTILQQTDR